MMAYEQMIDRPAEVRKGEELPAANLLTYLKSIIPGLNAIELIKQYPGGYSNLTYSLETNQGAFVLRRPPRGANIKSAHDMEREHRVLTLLYPCFKKVPRPVAYCADEEVIGAPFYLMQKVEGVILRNKLPEGIAIDARQIRQISENTMDHLAALHQLDTDKNGLQILGKPGGYAERQVHGWIGRYEKAQTDDIREMEYLRQWLPQNIPGPQRVSMLHNDYRYDNLVLDPEDLNRILAVLDWEMATVGDPLMDLGTALGYWAEAKDPPMLRAFSLTSLNGNYNREEIAAYYAEKTGLDIQHLVFYYAYASFKIAVIAQQIYKRYTLGFTRDKRFATLIDMVRICAGNGARAVDKGRISDLY